MVGHLTNEQLDTLVNLIAQYTQVPHTELEDVISSFLLTEADKPVDQRRESLLCLRQISTTDIRCARALTASARTQLA